MAKMSTSKIFDRICIGVLVFALVLTGLFMNGASLGMAVLEDEDTETYVGSTYFTANDKNGSWDTSQATKVCLEGTGGTIEGDGAWFLDGDLVIHNGGTYVISGELENGSIVVDAYKSSKVWILLDKVTLTCEDDACIRVDQADKVFLTLAEGTANTVSSGENFSEEALEDGRNAAVFSRDDLTINGGGSLSVTSAYKHGISCKDLLVIAGGTIEVEAAGDGIRANDGLYIGEAALKVNAKDDALVTAKEESEFYLETGEVSLVAEDDAIHAEGSVLIAGGSLTIDAGDDGVHAEETITVSGGEIRIDTCYEGLEAPQIDILDGEIVIHASDDGLNANGGSDETFGFGMGMASFGQMQGEPGSKAEQKSQEEAGAGENEETERKQQEEQGAQEEDGAGENEETERKQQNVQEEQEEQEESSVIRISGGTLTILNENGMDADGIDSNGDILITGGTIRISLTGTGGNNPLDYGSENGGICKIDGGTLIACGGSSMLEEISDTSLQGVLTYVAEESQEAGTNISLTDSEGNVLLEYEPPYSYSAVILSSPAFIAGETYTLLTGEESQEVTPEKTVTTMGATAGTGGGFSSMSPGSMQADGSMNPGPMQADGSMSPGSMQTDGSMSHGPMQADGSMSPGPMQADGSMNPGPMRADGSMDHAEGSNPPDPPSDGLHRGEKTGENGMDGSESPEAAQPGGMPDLEEMSELAKREDADELFPGMSGLEEMSEQTDRGDGREGPPGMQEQAGKDKEEETETEAYDSRISLAQLGSKATGELMAAVLLLVAGIGFSARYKRKK